jgi:CheY-like chemotaxis protein
MGKKILLVDDNKDLIYGMKIWLRANGYHVFFAMDAASAISVARAEKPDLILLDIGLPGGDGYMTMARLRSLKPLAHVPIIIVTAMDAFTHQKKALEAGAEDFFQKPVDNRQLLEAIQKSLGPRSPQRSLEKELPPVELGNWSGKKILIIDDDLDFLHGLRVRLRSHGYAVHLATETMPGIHLALGIQPDLILLDIELPGGDGYLAMTHLRSHASLIHVPIIVITAGDPSIHEEKARKAGAVAFLPKPIDNQQLLTAIQGSLGEAKIKSPLPDFVGPFKPSSFSSTGIQENG